MRARGARSRCRWFSCLGCSLFFFEAVDAESVTSAYSVSTPVNVVVVVVVVEASARLKIPRTEKRLRTFHTQ